VLLIWSVTNSRAVSEVDPRLKTFAAQKRQQMEELAATLHLDVPPEAREFFKSAERGDCDSVSNSYARIQRLTGQSDSSITMPGYTNVLNVPIHETRGAYEFCDWDGTLLQEYADGILSSIPAGSVYFGGTDPGRFVITMFRDTAKSPDIFILTQKFVITQNALEDTRYLDYLRLTCGQRLWLPSVADAQGALQEYGQTLQKRQQRGEQLGPDEHLDASGHARGVVAAMAVNGILTKMIVDRNKDKHEFYVEESYVIPWMYPYLQPHGLIMKLNKEPLAQLDPSVVARDREFWNKLTKKLLGDSKFLSSEAARKTYSKLRSAIGGLYAYRHLTDEAEVVYRQAITLYPASPEANFRLAQLYLELGRANDALAVLTQLQKLDPSDTKLAQAVESVRQVKRQADEKQSK
jgi:tetratricopeptide (TPR) repeat protein